MMDNHQHQHQHSQGHGDLSPYPEELYRKLQYGEQTLYFPPGFRFSPTHEELVEGYLKKKIKNEELPPNDIKVVEFYNYSPEELADKCEKRDGNWYFLTPTEKKYPNGDRPRRDAGDGYWRATGADQPVKNKEGVTIGFKKSLVFFKRQKIERDEKTKWGMHEYRVLQNSDTQNRRRRSPDDMRLDDWVLCKMHDRGKPSSTRNGSVQNDDGHPHVRPEPDV